MEQGEDNRSLSIESLSEATIEGVVRLQRLCFPPPFPEELLWTSSHLKEHLQRFPEGQFVAKIGDKVVGSATSLIISEENWDSHRSWEETVGGHGLRRHDPDGTTLYGVDISVDPGHRGRGVARALYQERFRLADQLSLLRYGTACRLPGVRDWKRTTGRSVQDYTTEVINGRIIDSTLTPLLRLGLSLVGVIENYMDDAESLNAAALLQHPRIT